MSKQDLDARIVASRTMAVRRMLIASSLRCFGLCMYDSEN